MTSRSVAPEGKVVVVSIDGRHRFSKAPSPSVMLVAGRGVEGDAHFGELVRHRYLARRNPRAPNLRQVHLIPSELLEALRADGYDVGPGGLGENVTTVGLDLERLDCALFFAAGKPVQSLASRLEGHRLTVRRIAPSLIGVLISLGVPP